MGCCLFGRGKIRRNYFGRNNFDELDFDERLIQRNKISPNLNSTVLFRRNDFAVTRRNSTQLAVK